MKINCWEYKKCGREPNGSNVDAQGCCPVSITFKMNGVHGGKNGGRCCWVIVGTFCGGKIQGSFAKKLTSCEKCDFFQLVKKEENSNFKSIFELLNELF